MAQAAAVSVELAGAVLMMTAGGWGKSIFAEMTVSNSVNWVPTFGWREEGPRRESHKMYNLCEPNLGSNLLCRPLQVKVHLVHAATRITAV